MQSSAVVFGLPEPIKLVSSAELRPAGMKLMIGRPDRGAAPPGDQHAAQRLHGFPGWRAYRGQAAEAFADMADPVRPSEARSPTERRATAGPNWLRQRAAGRAGQALPHMWIWVQPS